MCPRVSMYHRQDDLFGDAVLGRQLQRTNSFSGIGRPNFPNGIVGQFRIRIPLPSKFARVALVKLFNSIGSCPTDFGWICRAPSVAPARSFRHSIASVVRSTPFCLSSSPLGFSIGIIKNNVRIYNMFRVNACWRVARMARCFSWLFSGSQKERDAMGEEGLRIIGREREPKTSVAPGHTGLPEPTVSVWTQPRGLVDLLPKQLLAGFCEVWDSFCRAWGVHGDNYTIVAEARP
jgi:hypothetical protein